MLVVNLYAGPCVGKSTLAGDVFTKLKRAGIQAEIPPEVAKIRAQRGDTVFLQDQLAVFGETQHQLNMTARSGAQVAVVDSPILLSLVYMPKDYLKTFPTLVREVYDRFENLNYVLTRNPSHGYSQVGRVHTEQQALDVDQTVIQVLRSQNVPFRTADSSEFAAQCIVTDVLKLLRAAPAKPDLDASSRRLRAV